MKQIRTIFFRTPERLLLPPFRDVCVIPGEENLRDFPTTEVSRPGILWSFEQSGTETIICGGLFVTENAGQQSDNGIDQHDRSDRSIGQHVIANRNLQINQMFDHAVIDAFIMPADDDEM